MLLPAGVTGVAVLGDSLFDVTGVVATAAAFLAFDAFGVVGTTFGAGTALGCVTVFDTAAFAGTTTGAVGVIAGIGIGIEGAGDTAFVFFVAGGAF